MKALYEYFKDVLTPKHLPPPDRRACGISGRREEGSQDFARMTGDDCGFSGSWENLIGKNY
jgi:hypothetical protein